MDNSCEEIVRSEGVGWLFEKTVPPKGSLMLGALGTRDEGVQDIHVYRSNGASYIRVFNGDSFSDFGEGSLSIGFLINLPTGSDNGQKHIVLDVERKLQVYEQGGSLFFQIRGESEGLFSVSTSGLGVNLCDSKTHYVRVYRDSRQTQSFIGICLYDVGTIEVPVPNIDLSFTVDLYVGGLLSGNGLVSGSYLSGLYIYKGVSSHEEDMYFWLDGVVPTGVVLFMKLDEGSGVFAFDCSGYMNTGVIGGYSDFCRGVHTNFFSWQNMFGYSTGGYASGKDPFLFIDDNVLVPSLVNGNEVDIFGNVLEFGGRVRMCARLEDITCFKANGVTWGRVLNPSPLHLRPGQDEFTILAVFDKTEQSAGVLLSVGDRYRLEYSETGEFVLSIGGVQSSFSLTMGQHICEFSIGVSSCGVWVDGELIGTTEVGGVFSGGGFVDLMSANGVSILNGVSLTFVGIREGVFTSEERTSWFSGLSLVGVFRAAYYFYSFTQTVFDISGLGNHVALFDYDVNVWEGKQSVMPYLLGGFTEIYPNRGDMLSPVVIPFDMSGKKIFWNLYGTSQVEVDYDPSGGALIFDAYVNFNPFDKELGFWTQFWNKDNEVFWKSLNTRFLGSNPFKWNLQELTMEYLVRSLHESAYNFVFSGSNTGSFGFTTELVDLVLMNTGNNIDYKPIPL